MQQNIQNICGEASSASVSLELRGALPWNVPSSISATTESISSVVAEANASNRFLPIRSSPARIFSLHQAIHCLWHLFLRRVCHCALLFRATLDTAQLGDSQWSQRPKAHFEPRRPYFEGLYHATYCLHCIENHV